jgi:hypothetical protein
LCEREFQEKISAGGNLSSYKSSPGGQEIKVDQKHFALPAKEERYLRNDRKIDY